MGLFNKEQKPQTAKDMEKQMKAMQKEMEKQQIIEEEIKDISKREAVMILAKDEQGYLIVTGNHVLKAKCKALSDRIDALNKMDESELRESYQEILSKEAYSEKGGAGLGFIDILRKASGKLNCHFESINDTHDFFSLEVRI